MGQELHKLNGVQIHDTCTSSPDKVKIYGFVKGWKTDFVNGIVEPEVEFLAHEGIFLLQLF